MHYVNAGHEAPMIFRPGRGTELLDITGGVIGLFPIARFTVGTTRLDAGDLLFAYTDGVNEAKNSKGEQFGEQQILEAGTVKHVGAESFLANIFDAVRAFRGSAPQSDDITMLALKYLSKKRD